MNHSILVLASYGNDGSRQILDDFREAYYWLWQVQGHRLNMAMFLWYLVKKITCPVYTFIVAFTGQTTFYTVQEKHGQVYLIGL